MKRINVKQNCLLAVLLIITATICLGCTTKHEKLENELSKNGSSILENILEISNKYHNDLFSRQDVEQLLARAYGYTGEITQEALQKAYRLSFYFNHDTTTNPSIIGMVLLPCDSVLEKDDFTQYPVHKYTTLVRSLASQKKTYGVHFKVEDLEEIGYITNDQTEQKNLCLFQKEFNESMGYENQINSNKLVYTAEEINAIMDEYEALR